MSPAADRRVVLDASAATAWLMRERGHQAVAQVLGVGVLPASALAETLYRSRERGHGMPMPEILRSLVAMGVELEPVIAEDSLRAAELIEDSRRARQRVGDSTLSLGDGLCIAVAERLELPVTGGDQHWELLPLKVRYHPFR